MHIKNFSTKVLKHIYHFADTSDQNCPCIARVARIWIILCLFTYCLVAPAVSAQSVNVLFEARADSGGSIGTWMAALGDINHDGFDDIGLSNTLLQTVVFYGGKPASNSPAYTLRGIMSASRMCDMNGDGIPDAVTALVPEHGLLLFPGLDSSISTVATDSLSDSAGVNFGFIFFDVATVDSGPVGDLLVSDHDYPPGGRVQLYLNPFQGSKTAVWSWQNTSIHLQLWAGGFIDFNGDGAQDVYLDLLPDYGNEGFIYIFLGPAFGSQPNIIMPRPSGFTYPSDRFPHGAKNLSDVSGDGFDDLGVLYQYKPLIYFGGPNADSLPDLVLAGSGYSLASAADVNDDGHADILTGLGRVYGGAVDVYFGGPQLDSLWDFSIYSDYLPPIAIDNTGLHVGAAGDLNGDGHQDMFVQCTILSIFEPQVVFVIAGGRGIITDVPRFREDSLPIQFELLCNYPNPFNGSTVITVQLRMSADIDLSIFNVTGQLVRKLIQGQQLAGIHSVVWDGTNTDGESVASGIYVCKLSLPEVQYEQSRKLILLK